MVSMHVPWSVFIVMSSFSGMVEVGLPIFVHVVVSLMMVVVLFLMMDWLEVIVSMSWHMVNDWSFMLVALNHVLKKVWFMRVLFFMVSFVAIWTEFVLTMVSPVAFSVVLWVTEVLWEIVTVVIPAVSMAGSPLVWFSSMVSSFPTVVHWFLAVVHWILAVVVFAAVMAVTWIPMLPVSISMMVANIVVLITWEVLLRVGTVVVGWLSSHWRHMSRVMEISMHVMVVVWLHLKH